MPRRLFLVTLLIVTLVFSTMVPALAETEELAVAHSYWDVSEVVRKVTRSVVGVVSTLSPDPLDGSTRLQVGTGVIFRKDGYILTNAHVVEGAEQVEVRLPDKRLIKVDLAHVIADYPSDIAVLRLPGAQLPAADFANSNEVKVGQLVVAVGNPLGFRLGNSASAGIISGTQRQVGLGHQLLQTDAAINPGNSGGPLVDTAGRVVGINSFKVAGGAVEGLGFAIPSNQALALAEQLRTTGKIVRPWMGVTLREGNRASLGLPGDEGLTVTAIAAQGPAHGRLLQGDRIHQVNSKPVNSMDEMLALMAEMEPGQSITLSVARGQTTISRVIRLEQMPNQPLSAILQEAGGLWREISRGQAQIAVEHASRSLHLSYGDFMKPYIVVDRDTAVVLHTEYAHVAFWYWNASRIGSQLNEGGLLKAMGFIHGKLAVELLVQVRMPDVGNPPPFSEPTVELVQGDLRQTAVPTSFAHLFRGFYHGNYLWEARLIPFPTSGGFSRASFQFEMDSSQLLPDRPIQIRITEPSLGVRTATFELKDLR